MIFKFIISIIKTVQVNNMLKKLFMAASVSFADLATGNLSYKMTDSFSLDSSLAYISFDVYILYSVYYRAKDIKIGGLILAQATGWSDIIAIMSFSPSLSVPVSIVYNHCPSLSFGYDIAMLFRYFGLKYINEYVNEKFNWLPIASFFVEYNFGILSGKYHLGQALYAYNIYSVYQKFNFAYKKYFAALHGLEFKLNICHGWIASILLNSIYRSTLTWRVLSKAA